MYIVAGLPKSVHDRTLNALKSRFDRAIFKGLPSGKDDYRLYPDAYIEALTRSGGEFVIRRRGNGNAQPAPASITLLFVPSVDDEQLLAAFDFSAMLAPLTILSTLDERGRSWRHDPDAAIAALAGSIEPSADAAMNLSRVKERLARRSDSEALFLPPKNFRTPNGDFTAVFRALRRGERRWSDRFEDFGPTALKHDQVPDRVAHQQTRRPFVDDRGMAFFIAHPAAYDGVMREAEDDDPVSGIMGVLRSLYRFGGALEPGIHHDAQRADGSPLGGAQFVCSTKGRISGKSGYANIYPNDYVRIADYDREE